MRTNKILSIVIVCLLLTSLSGIAMAADFTDVDSEHKYYDEIVFCQSKNYITGTSATTFEPNKDLTRGQLAVILCRAELLQSLTIDVTLGSFNDIVPLKNYYDAAAIIMGCLKIINGTSEMTFSPNENVTREQLAVVITRMLDLGADDEDAYKVYNDYESISEWAAQAVSACLNADVFVGLYNGENFEPKKPVTRAEICKLIYTVSQPSHTITIADMTGGTVTASSETAKAGKLISLDVKPDTGKRLKADSLKYNGNDITSLSFVMPNEDVTITAEFEDIPVLQSIAITTEPIKTEYTVGETLDLAGLIVTATYSDGHTAEVEGYTTTPEAGSTLESAAALAVIVSYTEGEVEQTASFAVQVNEAGSD